MKRFGIGSDYMTTEMGQCKLCLKVKPLQNSHIIPELVFKPLYDDKHRFLGLHGDTGKYSIEQKGFRERLLCEECEKIFQPYEHYFSILWYKSYPLPNPVNDWCVERKGFDFEPFYRFHLSILWRASVAQRSEFSAVALGPFEEPLRQFLLGAAASLQFEPTVHGMILRFPQTHEIWNGLRPPLRFSHNGVTGYTFVFGGCSWIYYVSKQKGPFEPLRLRRLGTIIMPVIDYTEEGGITQALKAWQKTSRRKINF